VTEIRGPVAIIGAGATGVELAAELHRTTRELVAYGLDNVDPAKDIQVKTLPCRIQKMDRVADDDCVSGQGSLTRDVGLHSRRRLRIRDDFANRGNRLVADGSALVTAQVDLDVSGLVVVALDTRGRESLPPEIQRMLDVFVITLTVALVRFESFAVITAGPGALAFGCVVILTMLASMQFDPRLIWDNLEGGSPPMSRPVTEPPYE